MGRKTGNIGYFRKNNQRRKITTFSHSRECENIKTMQKQKGFILPIVIAVVVVTILGTGGYFVYKQYSKQIKQADTENNKQTQNQPIQNDNAYIKITSPNGGEVFDYGEEIQVAWESNKVDKVNIYAFYYDASGKVGMPDGKNYSFNEGECRLTYEAIPAKDGTFIANKGGGCGLMPTGTRIKIKIIDSTGVYADESDNYFSIVEADQTAGWKRFDSGDGFEFKYPTINSFVTLNEPEIIRGNSDINNNGCYMGNGNGRYLNPTLEKGKTTINNIQFCLSETGDSAMGSSYPTYFYTTTYKMGVILHWRSRLRLYRATGLRAEIVITNALIFLATRQTTLKVF